MFDYSDEEIAKADMEAMGYRSEMEEGLDKVVEFLVAKGVTPFLNDGVGTSYVNVELLYIMGQAFAQDGLQAAVSEDLDGAAAYAHCATVANVTARKAEGLSANVD